MYVLTNTTYLNIPFCFTFEPFSLSLSLLWFLCSQPPQPVPMDTTNFFQLYDPNSALITPTSTVAMPTSSQPVSTPSSSQLSQGVLSQAAIANLDHEQRTSLMNTLMHSLVASGNMQLLGGGEEGGNSLNAMLQSLLTPPQKTGQEQQQQQQQQQENVQVGVVWCGVKWCKVGVV